VSSVELDLPAQGRGDAVLEISGLCVDYGFAADAVHAVVDATLTLRRGEVLGLAGESGSGKSTLAYGLTRLLPPPGVIRSGDHSAEGLSNLLTLKTSVEKFQQGSETTRAVTTVGGFTKIFVRMQLAGKDGKLLIDKSVEGKIRFVGENLKATQDLTKGMTKILVQTSLPEAPVAAK